MVQLYVSYPAGSGEPPLLLRKFAKTGLLLPNEVEELTLTLTVRDLTIWDRELQTPSSSLPGGWARVAGQFTIYARGGSRDPRLEGRVDM